MRRKHDPLDNVVKSALHAELDEVRFTLAMKRHVRDALRPDISGEPDYVSGPPARGFRFVCQSAAAAAALAAALAITLNLATLFVTPKTEPEQPVIVRSSLPFAAYKHLD